MNFGTMRAILKFDLPDDQEEFEMARKAADLTGALYDLDSWLRGEIKWGDKDYQEVRDKLHEIMDERDINLDRLYR